MSASPDLLTLALLTMVAAIVLALALAFLAIWWNGKRSGAVREAPAARGWTRTDYATRMRSAYFSKERSIRAIRERERRAERRTAAKNTSPPSGDRPPQDGPTAAPTPSASEAGYRAILDLEGEITETGVRRAYLRQMSLYHPDKVAGLGIKIQVVAEEETKRINEAYAFFCAHYGF